MFCDCRTTPPHPIPHHNFQISQFTAGRQPLVASHFLPATCSQPLATTTSFVRQQRVTRFCTSTTRFCTSATRFCTSATRFVRQRRVFLRPWGRRVNLIGSITKTDKRTGHSSVGRASDCTTLLKSDCSWFDSGWPEIDYHF